MFGRIERTHEFIDNLLCDEETFAGYPFCWLNELTIREMERKLRKAKGIPFYYGFADFDLDLDTVIFEPWPLYYKYSHKFRRRQLRHRLGNWLRKILIPRLMK